MLRTDARTNKPNVSKLLCDVSVYAPIDCLVQRGVLPWRKEAEARVVSGSPDDNVCHNLLILPVAIPGLVVSAE